MIRRQDRSTTKASVQVLWDELTAQPKYANVKSYDISAGGMRIELPHRVEPRTLVRLNCPELKLQGTASVRFCRSEGSRYVVGLEFMGGLKWKLPNPSE